MKKSVIAALVLGVSVVALPVIPASAGEGNVSAADMVTLKRILDAMHGDGTKTGKYNGYKGRKPGYIPPPAGCLEHVVKEGDTVYVRWYDPTHKNPNC